MPYCEGIFARNGNFVILFTLYMLDGEEKVIRAAVEGDSSAFGSLYDHYLPQIYRFVVVKVGSREEAEDITHQVFLSAWTKIKTYAYRGHPFSSWLYQIARNLVVDHYRARKNDVSLEKLDPDSSIIPAAAHFDLAAKMEFEAVRSAMLTLKPEYQDVIILRFIEDLPVKDVAGILKRSEGAVKLTQHRAIKALRKTIGAPEEGKEDNETI